MMTLKQKKSFINNDINWEQVNKTSLLTTVAVMTAFLTTVQLMVI